MANQESLPVCETCPWLIKNHRRKHPAKWYTVSNLRRLWTGLRTGAAPGMICHSTDPDNGDYGGKGNVKPGHEKQCGGALLLIIMNINAISAGKPEPHQPPLKKLVIGRFLEKFMFGRVPAVVDRSSEVGLPWSEKCQK